MPIRTLPHPSLWSGDFLGTLSTQYQLLKLAPPVVSTSIADAQAQPELLLFFGEQPWLPDPPFQQDLATYAKSVSRLLPVIDDVKQAVTHLPQEVLKFNAFSRGRYGAKWPQALVDEVLTMTWQRRAKRRIFISYRRADAEAVARQLYQRYTNLSFEVFLDDLSIPRGVNFQAELHRWLDDADAVLLLISPELESSDWVREEIAHAVTHRIGLLGIVWPKGLFGAAGEPAAVVQVPADRRLRLDPPSDPTAPARTPLVGDPGAPEKQTLEDEALADVDHLLFTGRSQAIASRVRDIVDKARVKLDAEYSVTSVSADGDIELQHRVDQTVWFARAVPFRPEAADLFDWWEEQRKLAAPPAGVLVVYPELDPTDSRAVALERICSVWGAKLSPLLKLHSVRA